MGVEPGITGQLAEISGGVHDLRGEVGGVRSELGDTRREINGRLDGMVTKDAHAADIRGVHQRIEATDKNVEAITRNAEREHQKLSAATEGIANRIDRRFTEIAAAAKEQRQEDEHHQEELRADTQKRADRRLAILALIFTAVSAAIDILIRLAH